MIALKDLQDAKYIGDGAYVGHDGYQIWVLAHDGINTTNAVALEPDAADTLELYLKKIKEARGGTR